MTDVKLAELIGMTPENISRQTRKKEPMKYLFLKVGAEIVVDGKIDFNKIVEMKLELGIVKQVNDAKQ